jgi:hypothetical protein
MTKPNCSSVLTIWAVGLVIAAYYLWAAQAGGKSFVWNQDLGGYYDLAARGFAQGHLYLPIAPAKELLSLPNPWDPAANAPYRLHDAVLFGGHYYLLHLPGPAVALFLPWRLVIGHDLPENFALFLFCLGGFTFSAAALMRLLDLAGARPGRPMLVLMLLALGICQGVPYLLSTILMYQVAIGGGYFFLSAAIYCLVRAITDLRTSWCAASGVMFGFAMASRPHLAFAAIAAFVALVLLRAGFKRALAFAIPVTVGGLLLAGYNLARFGNIFEFGARYQLAGIPDSSILLSARNVLPGLYYSLFCAPDFSAVFPWVRLVLRFPFDSPSYALPPRYFLEPTGGALWSAPFLIGVAALPFLQRLVPTVRVVLWSLSASVAGVVVFLAATGFTTQRYEVDFLPMAVLLALAVFGALGWRWLPGVLIVFGLAVSLALGISGPNDEMLKNRPDEYMRIAGVFSPIAKFRPVLNPEFSTTFSAEFTAQSEHYREPLLTLGRQADRYYLYAEHVGGKVRIASYRELSEIDCLIDPKGPVRFDVKYDRGLRIMHVVIDGQERLRHPIGSLVTAPADITLGENRIDPNVTEARFTGRIQTAR